MSLGRLVPWTSWEEWKQVGDWLQSPDPAAIQRGLERVAAWRVRGRVPLGVDSTACFVETRLSDERGELGQVPLRMQYSLAVVRMVNGIADSSQKGRVAASVASLAAAAGLPRALVDLRHEATHNELPSLAALRPAAAAALGWLRDNYWHRQAANIETNLLKIDNLVGEYLKSHMAAATKAAAAAAAEEDTDSDGGESTAAPAVVIDGEYNVAAARKQRQALLTELRVSVPRPSAGMLVRGLLRAQRAAAAESPPSVVERALTHTVKHLREGWPELPAALLAAAARALGPASAPDSNKDDAVDDGSIDVKLWFSVFGSPALSEAAARAVLASALASLAAQAQAQLLQWVAGGGRDSTQENSKIPALLSLIELAAGCCAANSASGADLQRRCSALAAKFRENGTEDVADASALLSEAQELQAAVAVARKTSSASKRKREDETGAAGRKERKWKVVRDWAPCAIGMFPSAVDPNGRLPRLESSGGGSGAGAAAVRTKEQTAKDTAVATNALPAAVEEEKEEDRETQRCVLRDGLEGLEGVSGSMDEEAEVEEEESEGEEEEGSGPAVRRCPPPPTSVLPLI